MSACTEACFLVLCITAIETERQFLRKSEPSNHVNNANNNIVMVTVVVMLVMMTFAASMPQAAAELLHQHARSLLAIRSFCNMMGAVCAMFAAVLFTFFG